MRRHWSGLAPKSQFTQHNSHYTCNLVLHKAFWGTQAAPFLVGKSQCITTGTLTTPSFYCILQIIFHCFWTLWIQRTCRGITHGNVLNLWHHDRFLHHLEQDHVQNDQLDSPHYGLVPSVVFSFASFVCTFLYFVLFHQSHTSSSLFLIHTSSSLSVNLFPLQNISRVHPLRPSDLAISFLEFFAQATCKISLSLVW